MWDLIVSVPDHCLPFYFTRSHGIRKKGNGKRKKRAVKRSNTSLKDLFEVLEDQDQDQDSYW